MPRIGLSEPPRSVGDPVPPPSQDGANSYNPLTLITTQFSVAGAKLPGSPRNFGNLWVKYDGDGELNG